MKALSAEERAELRAVAEAATPGPWTRDFYAHGGWAGVECVKGRVTDHMSARPDDAEHIAAFDPPTALALLDAADRLAAVGDWLRRKAAEAELDAHWTAEDYSALVDELSRRLAAAQPPLPSGEHMPLAADTVDGMPFVTCSCGIGYRPHSAAWLRDHWQGSKAEGVAAIRALLAPAPAHPEDPVSADEGRGLAGMLAAHEEEGWVGAEEYACECSEVVALPMTEGGSVDAVNARCWFFAHQAAVVRAYLAALAADEQVRERVARAIHPDYGTFGIARRAAREHADAAVAAFLAAVEEGL